MRQAGEEGADAGETRVEPPGGDQLGIGLPAIGAVKPGCHCFSRAAKIAGYWGKSEGIDEALADFTEVYGDQTKETIICW